MIPVGPSDLRRHVRQELLPLWDRYGWDAAHGGFFSRLSHHLEPLPDGFKRLVVQMRQLYGYSIAGRPGEGQEWAAQVADRTFAHLRQRFWDPTHGGWYLTTSPEGEPLDRSKDAYAHAFAILGLAHYHHLRPRAGAGDLAFETLDLLERHLRDPHHAGFQEGAHADWSPRAAPRRHNPHMHLLEALLALLEVSGEERCRVAARRLVRLFWERLYVRTERGLPETFGPDWSLPSHPSATHAEPGHHFEWYWLLDRAGRLGVERPPADPMQALFGFAEQCGVDPRDGGVVDRVDLDGAVLDAGKRVWPQTEYLKALAIRLEASPGASARRQLEKRLAACCARYVDPGHRGWLEQADARGTIVSDAMNATTVYHVLTALDEVARVLDEVAHREGHLM